MQLLVTLIIIGAALGLLFSKKGEELQGVLSGAKKGAGCGCLIAILIIILGAAFIFMLYLAS